MDIQVPKKMQQEIYRILKFKCVLFLYLKICYCLFVISIFYYFTYFTTNENMSLNSRIIYPTTWLGFQNVPCVCRRFVLIFCSEHFVSICSHVLLAES